MTTERRISVSINGPEGMLEAMAKVLREEHYLVLKSDARPLLTAADRAVVASMAGVKHEFVMMAASNQDSPWHEPAVAELVRRGAFDELETARAGWERARKSKRKTSKRSKRTKRGRR